MKYKVEVFFDLEEERVWIEADTPRKAVDEFVRRIQAGWMPETWFVTDRGLYLGEPGAGTHCVFTDEGLSGESGGAAEGLEDAEN